MRPITAPVAKARQDSGSLAILALGVAALFLLTRKPATTTAPVPPEEPGPTGGHAALPLEAGEIRIWAHDKSEQQPPLIRREATV